MKAATFAYTTPNLGDDLQAMATAAVLPHVDRLVDRDNIGRTFLPEPHLVVTNSWFQLRIRDPLPRPRLPPSPSFTPVFHGFCVGSPSLLNRHWIPYLKSHQPIGCRDTYSAEKLRGLGIETYWSGCLTVFYGRAFRPVPREERQGIVFVDVPPAAEKEFVPETLRRSATRISNFVPEAMRGDPLRRMNQMAKICDRLRRAEFVVTRRLHTALPCVGFGTPVAVLLEALPKNTQRFSGFDGFLPMIQYGSGRASGSLDWNSREPIVAPPELEEAFSDFRQKVADQMGAVHDGRADDVAVTSEILVENPGLGEKPGELAIDLGRCRVTRSAESWTDREITLKLDHFAGFERFNSELLVRGYGSEEWLSLGPIGRLLQKSRTDLPAA